MYMYIHCRRCLNVSAYLYITVGVILSLCLEISISGDTRAFLLFYSMWPMLLYDNDLFLVIMGDHVTYGSGLWSGSVSAAPFLLGSRGQDKRLGGVECWGQERLRGIVDCKGKADCNWVMGVGR